MGGSEYFEYCLNLTGGDVPKLDLPELRQTIITIKSLLGEKGLINAINDCSKGGLIVALLKMAIQSKMGFQLNTDSIPNTCSRLDFLLFSESHNRFLITTSNPSRLVNLLERQSVPYAEIGTTKSDRKCIINVSGDKSITIELCRLATVMRTD